jgi:membrane protein YdbS with pleckstrin-like domain
MTHQPHWAPPTKKNLKRGFWIHFLVFLLTNPVIWLVWYLTGSSYPWPAWASGSWTVGVIFHYLGVFVFKKSKGN